VTSLFIQAGDIIMDFEPTVDKIDLVGVLNSINFTGTNPIAEGYVTFGARGSDTLLNIDTDGPGSGLERAFILVKNVSVADLNNPANFIFN
jgi:hypothetical protein